MSVQTTIGSEKFPKLNNSFWLFVIFLVALGLRLLYLWLYAQPTPVVYDAEGYYKAGLAIAGFRDFAPERWNFLGMRGPGYALFLATIFSLFSPENLWPVRYLQAIIGTLSCLVVYLTAGQLAGRRVAVIAGFLMAFYPSLILLTERLITETLAIFLFWLGLYLLVRGLRFNALGWLIAAGATFGLACLTRPTLLPALPFLMVAVVVSGQQATIGRRIFLSIIFTISVLSLLLAWNMFIRTRVDTPTVGAGGIATMIDLVSKSTHPAVRGWSPDDRDFIANGLDNNWWREAVVSKPLYPVAAAANLIFYHWWFADNAWRETFMLSPAGMHGWQRVLVGLGLGGIGLALLRWRVFAPLLLLLVSFALVSIKWIEIRHHLPFVPIIFILAGLFLVNLIEWLGHYPGRVRLGVVGGAGLALAIVLGYQAQLFNLSLLLPFVSPVRLGSIGDWLVLLLSFLWGGLVFKLAQSQLGRRQALVAGFVPPVLFALLFGAYVYVGSAPRWWAWEMALNDLRQTVEQEIYLPAPIPAEQIDMVAWLVDMQIGLDSPPLKVGMNGTRLLPEQYRWQPLFCAIDTDIVAHTQEKWCPVYETLANGQPLAQWPQWWSIPIDPTLVGDKEVLLLTLAQEEQIVDPQNLSPVNLGGTFSTNAYGPSVNALLSNQNTSFYRWQVLNDWRLWETNKLAGKHTASYVAQAGLDKQSLPGYLNIRLLIRFKDGRVVIY